MSELMKRHVRLEIGNKYIDIKVWESKEGKYLSEIEEGILDFLGFDRAEGSETDEFDSKDQAIRWFGRMSKNPSNLHHHNCSCRFCSVTV